MEEDVAVSPVREARKDFPRMGGRKLLVCLASKLEGMNIHIVRDAFLNCYTGTS
jgi:hypothetical protein